MTPEGWPSPLTGKKPVTFRTLATPDALGLKTRDEFGPPFPPRDLGLSPLLDLQEQRDQFALAMRIRLGKDGFQLISRRLP